MIARGKLLGPLILNKEYPSCVIFDLDGTLACIGDRSPYAGQECMKDSPNTSVCFLNRLVGTKSDLDIIIFSGRFENSRSETLKWLDTHNVQFNALYLRKDGDFRKDFIIKKEMFNRYILGHYNVMFAVDDRDQVVELWRKLGITCFQVAPGSF